MLASIQKVLAVAGTPIAAILAIGVLTEVTNLWRVENTYKFSYIEGWHAVGVIDRWVLIGIGVKYLFFTLLVLLFLLGLAYLIRWVVGRGRSIPASAGDAQGTWTAWWIQTSTPPGGTAQSNLTAWWTQTSAGSGGDTPKTLAERWVWLVIAATVVLFIWLPLHAWISPNDDRVLDYLPHIDMTVAVDSSDSLDSMEGDAQTFSGVAKPAEEEGEGAYTVSGSIELKESESQNGQQAKPVVMSGVLLSHDANYWYILSQEGFYEGNIVAVPLDEATDIRVTSPQTPNQEDGSSQEQDVR